MEQRSERFFKNRKGLKALAVLMVLAVLALTAAVSVPLVRFASQPERFRQWVQSQGILGVAAYMGMVIVQVVIALVPGEPFEIAAGYAFGAWEGTLLYLLAATMGSLAVFFLVRRYGKPFVLLQFPGEKIRYLRFLKTDPRRELLFLLIFMLPGVPKDLMCYFAGLTDMWLPVWLVICSLGRIPSAITSTLGGDALGEKNYLFAGAVFLAALAVSAGGLLIFHRVCANKNEDGTK